MKKFSFIGLFLASFSFLPNENVEATEWVVSGTSNVRMDESNHPTFAECRVNIKENGKSITGFPKTQTVKTGLIADFKACIIRGEVKDKDSGILLVYDVSAAGFRVPTSDDDADRSGDCNQTVIIRTDSGREIKKSNSDGVRSLRKCGRQKVEWSDRPPQ